MVGTHFIKGWARAQNHVTLSSAEAELIALVQDDNCQHSHSSVGRTVGVKTTVFAPAVRPALGQSHHRRSNHRTGTGPSLATLSSSLTHEAVEAWRFPSVQ